MRIIAVSFMVRGLRRRRTHTEKSLSERRVCRHGHFQVPFGQRRVSSRAFAYSTWPLVLAPVWISVAIGPLREMA